MKQQLVTLDIQSYLLRFGVWMVYLGGPTSFPAGVWMSRVIDGFILNVGLVPWVYSLCCKDKELPSLTQV